ncbi:glycosyltransferase family 8 protein [Microvirga sp. 2YAF29]|uniref:glycosyltransferase family 8 protein n=1 Tax=Microvirga sp. 2YAF29 TaxID=3233031 RepID=UPI003F97A87D
MVTSVAMKKRDQLISYAGERSCPAAQMSLSLDYDRPIMKDRLVVFTTDRDFVVPTIAAALQIASQERVSAVADLLVYLIGVTIDESRALHRCFGEYITFERMEAEHFLPPKGTVFNQTHVSEATLARLVLGDLLPEQYEHIIYLDGDIYINGDISPLIMHTVEKGRILAACDGVWLLDGESSQRWRETRTYLDDLGIADPRDYFNAGVLAFRRSSWKMFSSKAMQYYLGRSVNCRFHDQSALNAVCIGSRDILSPAYNFTSLYANLDRADAYDVRIIHFTGGMKPWFYDGPPWNGRFLNVYQDVLDRYPTLRAFHREAGSSTRKAMQRAYWKHVRNSLLMPWRIPVQRRKLERYLHETRFAF